MKIRFLGIGINSGEGVNLSEFKDHLIKLNGVSTKLGVFERYFYCKPFNIEDDKSQYIAGLLITVKDHKKFCELQKEDGKLIVRVKSTDDNSDLMDFNFFIANMSNGLFLYQHYHNSCSTGQFGKFLQREYKSAQEDKKDAEKNAEEKLTTRKKTSINKKYKKGLTFELMVRPEKLTQLMAELETVRDFEIDFFELKATDNVFKPLNNYVKKERRKFSFVADTKSATVSAQLNKIVNKFKITDGKITGRDLDGMEKIIHLSDNPDNFGEYEFDDVASKLNSLDMDDFLNNWVVKELKKTLIQSDHIFKAEIRK